MQTAAMFFMCVCMHFSAIHFDDQFVASNFFLENETSNLSSEQLIPNLIAVKIKILIMILATPALMKYLFASVVGFYVHVLSVRMRARVFEFVQVLKNIKL